MTEEQLTRKAIAVQAKRISQLEEGGITFRWRNHVVEMLIKPDGVTLAFKAKGEDNMSWEITNGLDEARINDFFANPESFWGW